MDAEASGKVRRQTIYASSRLLGRVRFRLLKLVYDGFFVLLKHDLVWQEPLISSLAPKPNNRVLNFGPGSGSTTVAISLRYPQASFFAVDPDPKAAEKARKQIARQRIENFTVVDAPRDGRLPFDAGSFDKVACLLAFHDRLPDEKIGIAKELMRVLRHGGTLHVVDYDKPDKPGEGTVLKLAKYVSGAAAVESHIDGSWIDFLTKAGFSRVRRQSSQVIRGGRISVINARRR
jgi:ubiquinone/menaquinone biosynthesis C-methylase UbiE